MQKFNYLYCSLRNQICPVYGLFFVRCRTDLRTAPVNASSISSWSSFLKQRH